MIAREPRMEISRRNGLKNLRLGQSTSSSKLTWEPPRIKEPWSTSCSSKESLVIVVIGPILTDGLPSPASVLKFDRVNPAPVMTKRMTALTPITKGSWPPMRYSVQNALITRSITSQRNLTWIPLIAIWDSGITVQKKEAARPLLSFYTFVHVLLYS